MSCSLTIPSVLDRTKVVTRRHVDTWKQLKAGDLLTLVEKGQGIPAGGHQVILTGVQVVAVTVEPLEWCQYNDEVAREGFAGMDPIDFMEMWLTSHHELLSPTWAIYSHYMVRRIEWRYLDG